MTASLHPNSNAVEPQLGLTNTTAGFSMPSVGVLSDANTLVVQQEVSPLARLQKLRSVPLENASTDLQPSDNSSNGGIKPADKLKELKKQVNPFPDAPSSVVEQSTLAPVPELSLHSESTFSSTPSNSQFDASANLFSIDQPLESIPPVIPPREIETSPPIPASPTPVDELNLFSTVGGFEPLSLSGSTQVLNSQPSFNDNPFSDFATLPSISDAAGPEVLPPMVQNLESAQAESVNPFDLPRVQPLEPAKAMPMNTGMEQLQPKIESSSPVLQEQPRPQTSPVNQDIRHQTPSQTTVISAKQPKKQTEVNQFKPINANPVESTFQGMMKNLEGGKLGAVKLRTNFDDLTKQRPIALGHEEAA